MDRNMRFADALSPNEQRERRPMQVAQLKLAGPTALLAVVLATAAGAEDKSPVAKQDVHAKLAYCEVCHGVSAQGFLGYYPIPRLAGQQIEYIKNQLQALVEHQRTNNIMFNVGHVLSPAMITALAADFHDLNPKPLGDAPKELVGAGKKIYEEGVPGTSRHAPPVTERRLRATGSFPVSRVSSIAYVTRKLTDLDKERGQDPGTYDIGSWQPIAHSLTDCANQGRRGLCQLSGVTFHAPRPGPARKRWACVFGVRGEWRGRR